MRRNLQQERKRRADFLSRYGKDLDELADVSQGIKQVPTVRLSPVKQLATVGLSPQRALVGKELILTMTNPKTGIEQDLQGTVTGIQEKRFGRRRKHRITLEDGTSNWMTLKRPHSRKGVSYILLYDDDGRGRHHTKRKPRRRRHHGTRKPRRRRHHGTKKHRRSTKHRG